MEEDKVLESVVENLEYIFIKDVLVKPMHAIMISKVTTTPVPTGEKDEEGYEKYDTKSETKDVESEYKKGIVLSIPKGDYEFKVGDMIVYPSKFAKDFDLFKDSQLVKPYDVIAVYTV